MKIKDILPILEGHECNKTLIRIENIFSRNVLHYHSDKNISPEVKDWEVESLHGGIGNLNGEYFYTIRVYFEDYDVDYGRM